MRFRLVIASVLMACVSLASFAQTWNAPDDSVPLRMQKYPTREAAEAAWAAYRERIRTSFQPREAPLAGSVKIVAPSREFVEKMMRVRMPQLFARASQEGVDFVIRTYMYGQLQQVPVIIKRRNIFEHVTVEEIPGSGESGHVNPVAGEVVIYLYWPEARTSGWYYKSNRTSLTPLDYDMGAAEGSADRIRHLIDSVEALAAGEKQ
jgi:hypothetical protein